MRITYKAKSTDPAHPIMHGTSPTAKEFNKRQAALWKEGNFEEYNWEQVATILLEIFTADYDRRHAPRKKSQAKK